MKKKIMKVLRLKGTFNKEFVNVFVLSAMKKWYNSCNIIIDKDNKKIYCDILFQSRDEKLDNKFMYTAANRFIEIMHKYEPNELLDLSQGIKNETWW